jgi:hypothetical protein
MKEREMSADKDPKNKPRGDRSDPRDDATQPIAKPASPGAKTSHPALDSADTTARVKIAPPKAPPSQPQSPPPSAARAERAVASEPAPAERDEPPDNDTTETVVAVSAADAGSSRGLAPSSSLIPMLLERIEPSLGRGERMRLDASHWRLSIGRAEESDVRLYTVSASREHAVIAGNDAGQWVLTLAPGKAALIDGDPVSGTIELEVGMNIILGQDHLRCVAEGLVRRDMTVATAADGFDEPVSPKFPTFGQIAPGWWLIGSALFVLLVAGLVALSGD